MTLVTGHYIPSMVSYILKAHNPEAVKHKGDEMRVALAIHGTLGMIFTAIHGCMHSQYDPIPQE